MNTVGERALHWAAPEHLRLVAWLDSVLRPGSDVSLADDAPFLLGDLPGITRRVLVSGLDPVAHAAAYPITVDLPRGSIRAAVIGAVATSEGFRHQGLGSRVMEALLEDLGASGVSLAVLWADVPEFYERLGFVLGGREAVFVCPKESVRGSRRLRARPANPKDLDAIIALHRAEICRVRRDPAAWGTLFRMPRTHFYVLERRGAVIAYGVVGKGHDLRGCLHEWGGDETLLPTLVSAIYAHRREPELYVMCPPWKRQAARAMSYHRITPHVGALGMLKVLDRGALLESLGLRDAALPEDHAGLVTALFGAPGVAPPGPCDGLPLPFYLFGLDSM